MPNYEGSPFDPPAPVARVTIASTNSNASIHDVPMLLDTGADVSLIPRSAARLLSLPETGGYMVSGFSGGLIKAAAVRARLSFSDLSFKGVFLVTTEEYGILGRNILNQIPLSLDGPQGTWEVAVSL